MKPMCPETTMSRMRQRRWFSGPVHLPTASAQDFHLMCVHIFNSLTQLRPTLWDSSASLYCASTATTSHVSSKVYMNYCITGHNCLLSRAGHGHHNMSMLLWGAGLRQARLLPTSADSFAYTRAHLASSDWMQDGFQSL